MDKTKVEVTEPSCSEDLAHYNRTIERFYKNDCHASDVYLLAFEYGKNTGLTSKGMVELGKANSKLFSAFVKSLLDSNGYTIAKLKEKDPMIFNEAYEYWVDNLPDYTDLITKIKALKL